MASCRKKEESESLATIVMLNIAIVMKKKMESFEHPFSFVHN
jgi:hypothetical protein